MSRLIKPKQITQGTENYILATTGGTTSWAPLSAITTTVNELNDLSDVTTGLPVTPTIADDGKLLFYHFDTNQWITDDTVNHGTVVINAKKSTAGTIAKGNPVYLVGFDSDIHTVEIANATSSATMPVIGLAGETLDDTNSKHVITFGKITGIDTTSGGTLANGEVWAVNDDLYVDTTTGELTKIRPIGASTQIQRVAKVLRVDATGGQLFVFNTARTAGLPNLTSNTFWIGNSNNQPVESSLSDALSTTANCISDLYVSKIHSCSPLLINPNDEGNVYIGSDSGFTYDISTSGLTITGPISFGDDIRKDGTTILNVELGSNGNTVFGESAMNIDTISGAIRNTAIGYDAGSSITSGDNNTFIGWGAGRLVTTTSSNIAIGSLAMYSNSGSANIAMGTNTLDANGATTGTIAIGDGAGGALTGGLDNILIGRNTSTTTTTTSYNIAIGNGAGPITNISNTMSFGRGAIPTAAFQCVMGGSLQRVDDFILGAGPDTVGTGAVNTTIRVTNIADGEVNKSSGFDLHLAGGKGTGTGNGGDLLLQVAPAGISGTSQNPLVDIITLAGATGDVSIASTSLTDLFKTDYSADMVGIGGPTLNARLHVKGAGSTSATDAFLIENSSGNNILTVQDDGNVGIGTDDPQDNLQVGTTANTATFRYVDGNQADGYVLTSDANGVATWMSGATGGGGTSKYAADVPMTGGTVETVTHSLGSTDVLVQVKNPSGELIIPGTVDNYTTNTVDIEVSVTGTYRVIIIG